jgi:hypothetical protein
VYVLVSSPYGPRVGSLLDDVLSPFKSAADAVGDIVSRVPGSAWVGQAFSQGATWIGEMAKTPWGFTILTAATGTFVLPNLAPIVGPQIASVAWTIPELAQGQCFSTAYIQELTHRAEAVATYFFKKDVGDGSVELPDDVKQQIGAQVAQVTDQIKELYANPAFQGAFDVLAVKNLAAQANLSLRDALAQLKLSPEDVAARFGVLPISAAMLENLLLCSIVFSSSEFDVPTGRGTVQVPSGAGTTFPSRPGAAVIFQSPTLPIPALPDGSTSAEILDEIQRAASAGATDANLTALRAQYAQVLGQEVAHHAEVEAAAQARAVALQGGFVVAPPAPSPPGPTAAPSGLLPLAAAAALLTLPLWLPRLSPRAARRLRLIP